MSEKLHPVPPYGPLLQSSRKQATGLTSCLVQRDPPFLSTTPHRHLKMRDSAHSTEKRRLIIEQGGLRVERVAS
jgi:hypothetical protein